MLNPKFDLSYQAFDSLWKNYSFIDDELDLSFYQGWYQDLVGKNDKELHEHWTMFGLQQRRSPNFKHLLNKLNLQVNNLPPSFIPELYLSLHQDLGEAQVTWFHAVIHYLQEGVLQGRTYNLDFDFYVGYYSDLLDAIQTPEQALEHWIDYGFIEGRYPTLRHLLQSMGFQNYPILSGEDYRYLKQQHSEFTEQRDWKIQFTLIHQEQVKLYRLSEDDSYNLAFYRDLAKCYEVSQQDSKAYHINLLALKFGQDSQVYENLANYVFRNENYEKAIQFYQASIKANTHSYWVYANLTRSLIRTRNFKEAFATISQAITLFPDAAILDEVVKEVITELWKEYEQQSEALIELRNIKDALQLSDEFYLDITQVISQSLHRNSKNDVCSPKLNTNSVLIIGDFHVPQCIRYRISQKIEQLKAVGYSARAVSWTDSSQALHELSFADQVIFYRVPAIPEVVNLILTAQSIGKVTFYEIDDLLFDESYPPPIETYGGFVDRETHVNLTKGMLLMRKAAQLCEYGIASTKPLATHLSELVKTKKVYVHRNGLDYAISEFAMAKHVNSETKDYINIFYGSGTQAHNSDFVDCALPAIERILSEYSNVKFTVVGYLNLPQYFIQRYKKQIIQMDLVVDVASYWEYLSHSDINIAVLKQDKITDCKSELKWIEAAAFGIPSVVSKTQCYSNTILDGKDGFIVSTVDDWYNALSRLVKSMNLRKRIGASAKKRVLSDYSVETLSKNIKTILDNAVADKEGFIDMDSAYQLSEIDRLIRAHPLDSQINSQSENKQLYVGGEVKDNQNISESLSLANSQGQL